MADYGSNYDYGESPFYKDEDSPGSLDGNPSSSSFSPSIDILIIV